MCHLHLCSRRAFLKTSAAASLLLAEAACTRPQNEWQRLSDAGATDEKLRVVALAGEATSNLRAVSMGDVLEPQQVLEVAPQSELTLGLPDGSAVRLTEDSKARVALLGSRGGELTLSRGGLSGAIAQPTRRRYLVRTPTAIVGVKGTVFHAEAAIADDPTRGYFCLCNGNADFLTRERSRSLLQIRSNYHNAFYTLLQDGKPELRPVEVLLRHSDASIRQLLESGAVPHTKDWLRDQG